MKDGPQKPNNKSNKSLHTAKVSSADINHLLGSLETNSSRNKEK